MARVPGRDKARASLRVKLFLSINGLILVVMAGGLTVDVYRHYRSYHTLLYERMTDDARLWQLAWRQSQLTGRPRAFVEDYQRITRQADSGEAQTFVLVVAPGGGGVEKPWRVLASLPEAMDGGLRRLLLDHATDAHAMVRLGKRGVMIVSRAMDESPSRLSGSAAVANESRPPVNPSADGERVVLAEFSDRLHGEIAGQILDRVVLIVVVVLWVVVVVNLLLYRWVTRPVARLAEAAERIGRGQYDQPIPTRWGTRELDDLATSFDLARRRLYWADGLRRANLTRARRTQRALLPDLGRPIAGVSAVAFYEPVEDIGGDFYDLQQGPDGLVAVLVGDASGHGVPAALMMAMVKTDLSRLVVAAGLDGLTALAEQLNRDLMAISEPSDFVTLLAMQFTPGRDRVRYINAGHPPARRVRRDGSIRYLEPTGPLIGVLEDARWQQAEMDLAPGDRLVLLTDGLVETFNPDGERFGLERLDVLLTRLAGRPADELVGEVRRALSAWRGREPVHDDLTVLVVDLDPAATAGRA